MIFEGGYLNGKSNGNGKEYDNEGILIFEGQYLDNKKWDGKGYNKFNNIIYELKNGKGLMKEFLDNELIYEGEYKLLNLKLLSCKITKLSSFRKGKISNQFNISPGVKWTVSI